MLRLKTKMTSAVIGAAAIAAMMTGASAADKTSWSLGTSSTGSGPFLNGIVISKNVNPAQDMVEVSSQTTGGFNENLALVASKRVNLGMGAAVDFEAAYAGTGKFAKVDGNEIFKNLRVLFISEAMAFHFLTRADSGIKTMEDIKGKIVNINRPSTFTRGFNLSILETMDIGLDEITTKGISTGKHFDALKDRVIDVGFHSYVLGLAKVQELNATTDLFLLSLPDAAFERLNKRYGGILLRHTIPANTYKGQTEPSKTVVSPGVLYVHKDTPDDEVYAFTKAFWENIEQMGVESGAFKPLRADISQWGGKAPVHPGAQRYFDEIAK